MKNDVTPFDLMKKDNYTSKRVRDERFDICKSCEYFVNATSTCTRCLCFMAVKTWLKNAHCPIHKWGESNEAYSS